MIRTQSILLILAAALALLSAGLLWYLVATAPSSVRGSTSYAAIGGPFVLTDQNGRKRSDRDYRGRHVLLYFGYTSCPDVCPTTLQTIADALPKLGSKAASVTPVFITLDPERDSPEVLKKYLSAFGSQFVGLTGSIGEITRVAHAYRIYFAKHPMPGGSYSVDHSSILFLVGPDGKLASIIDAGTDATALANTLKSKV